MNNKKVVIIGSGYQGLIAASLMALNGISVHVVELANDADYAEIMPGFRTGPCTHIPVTLPYAVVDALALEAHGLDVSTLKSIMTSVYSNDADGFDVTENPFTNLPFLDSLAYLETALQELEFSRPPYKEKAWRDTWGTFELGRLLANTSPETQKIFSDSTAMSLHGLLEHLNLPQHEKAMLSALALMGSRTDPTAKGSACALIPAYTAFNHVQNAYTVTGSLHELVKVLKQAAMTYGAQFAEGQVLSAVHTRDGQIESVELDGGEKLTADHFVLDTDPVHFFSQYVDSAALPPAFKTRISPDQFLKETVHIKMAVSALPQFTALAHRDDAQDILLGQIFIAPDPSYITDARGDMKKDGGAQLPVISMIIPSVKHDSLAESEGHSISIMAQYFAADLPDDRDTDDAVLLACIQAVDAYAPGFSELVRYGQVIRGASLVETHSQFGQPQK